MQNDRIARRIAIAAGMALERRLLAAIALASLLVSSQAAALSVKVDFSADLSGLQGIPSVGTGSISGTLGTFEVTSASQSILLDDVVVDISGFDPTLFPTTSATLNMDYGLEFLLLVQGPLSAPTGFVGSGLGGTSPDSNPARLFDNGLAGCPADPGQNCALTLLDDPLTGTDLASATWSIEGTGSVTHISIGELSYTFRIIGDGTGAIVPEPSAAVLFVVGFGVAGMRLRGRRR